jgi:putative FmdB family regulatory protein
MPTYEYQCDKCGHEFEKFQSMADRPLTTCPKELCKLKTWGKGKVRKLISSGAGLLFKGSGFYITDYRSENYKSGAKKESGAKESGSKESKDSGSASSSSTNTNTSAGESKSSAGAEKKAAPKADAKPAKASKSNG